MFRICAEENQGYGAIMGCSTGAMLIGWHTIQSMSKTGNAAQDADTLVHFAVFLHLLKSLCFISVRTAGSGHVSS
jgi:hypothetical protein